MKIAPRVAQTVAKRDSRLFKPTIVELFEQLKTNPQQYPLKTGPLVGYRAAAVRYNRSAEWRCVFKIDSKNYVVTVVALDSHDEAYEVAKRQV